MRRTTGELAYWAAIGGGFLPLIGNNRGRNPWWCGVEQPDGTFLTVLVHADGRSMAIRTRRGDGWQRGKLVRVVTGGPWLGPMGAATVDRWQDVRRLLRDHEPGREHPYCGGAPIRQPRALDGRERDILYRILRDIERALRDPEAQRLLGRVLFIDQKEVYRLMEMQVILDGRDD